MPKITFMPNEELCPNGMEVDAIEGQTICDVALKNGIHSEYMGFILTEMQFLQRTFPDAKW